MIEKILKFIQDKGEYIQNEIKLTEIGVHSLLNYPSGNVKDALDHIFKKSEFIGKQPMDGVIKNGKEIIFFETPYISYLEHDIAMESALVKGAPDPKRIEFLTSTF